MGSNGVDPGIYNSDHLELILEIHKLEGTVKTILSSHSSSANCFCVKITNFMQCLKLILEVGS
jgi:hypothetical protein